MRNALRNLWQSRAPWERLLVGVLAAFLGAMLYVAFVQSASRARVQLDKSVSRLRDDALRINRSADEVLRLRALPEATQPVSATDLRALAQAKVD